MREHSFPVAPYYDAADSSPVDATIYGRVPRDDGDGALIAICRDVTEADYYGGVSGGQSESPRVDKTGKPKRTFDYVVVKWCEYHNVLGECPFCARETGE